METLKIKRLTKTATLPRRGTSGSAGFDLFADLQNDIVISPQETLKISTGIALSIDNNAVGLVYARSGLATNFGITLANAVGVIDSDYRGEIVVALFNNSNAPYIITPQAKIAQLVLAPIFTPALVEVDELEETTRGDGGFGSTGD